ncbi:MAG: glucose-1-phosphate thymidylyltransferase [Armatimonadota bacterium]|nr:glucose-1-phosphate thymidylyltransferase [Armatimonadota bacterium]
MKAVVLCAGRGTRLRPLTHTGAKHLIPVANRPILFHVLDDLADAGIESTCMVVSEGAQDLREALGSGERWGMPITYAVQESPRGLAHAVQVAQDFVADERFVVYLGDNLFENGISEFVQKASQQDGPAAVLLAPVPDPRRFGVAQLDRNGRLTAVEEKPADPPSNLALTGAYMFAPAIFDAIDSITPSARGELEITGAIQHLIANGGEVAAFRASGWWRDTGKPEQVLDVNRLLLEALPPDEAVDPADLECKIEGRVYVQDGAVVEDSLIRGPVTIASECHVARSFVGPFTSIGEGSSLVDVEIENSIVMPDCHIEGVDVRLDSSILGRQVRLEYNNHRPAGGQFLLADHSEVFLSSP